MSHFAETEDAGSHGENIDQGDGVDISLGYLRALAIKDDGEYLVLGIEDLKEFLSGIYYS